MKNETQIKIRLIQRNMSQNDITKTSDYSVQYKIRFLWVSEYFNVIDKKTHQRNQYKLEIDDSFK